jgi:2-oxo-4-hydroxy-4-carboxy--5-ureidoimidazoline (OHCU) decarboxylase
MPHSCRSAVPLCTVLASLACLLCQRRPSGARKLSVDELAQLFSGRTALVERLAEHEDPLAAAEDVITELTDEEKTEALAAHPRVGEASPEQRGDEPDVLTELAYLNQVYEEKFGFRFVVFVNKRPRSEIVPILRERLQRTRAEELETGLRELVAIARDRRRSRS